mgnify:CR=1 FL=1
MSKTAEEIFAEADRLLSEVFYVVEPWEHLSCDQGGEPEYDGKDFLCLADIPPADGGFGRSESRTAGKRAKADAKVNKTNDKTKFKASTARNDLRTAERAVRVAHYTEQIEDQLAEGVETATQRRL